MTGLPLRHPVCVERPEQDGDGSGRRHPLEPWIVLGYIYIYTQRVHLWGHCLEHAFWGFTHQVKNNSMGKQGNASKSQISTQQLSIHEHPKAPHY